jgi:CRP-like cAMP-binding protein
MSKDSLIDALRAIVPVSEDEADWVRQNFSKVNVLAKSFLLSEGEVCHNLFFIVSGCARIGIDCPNGEDISCYFAREGEWISIYESFLSGQPSEYFVQTLEDCEMLTIDRKGVEDMYNRLENGNLMGRRLMEGLFITTVQRLTDFYKLTPEQRFQNFLVQYPNLANRIPQNCLASYIGVKPQSLSRIKKRIMETG